VAAFPSGKLMRGLKTFHLMIAAAAVAAVLAAVAITVAAPGDRLAAALRATARWSFVWFCSATIGGALATLFGPRFQALAGRARDLGLAFASAHLVHVGLVAVLLYRSATPFPRFQLVFFGIGVFWVYLLAVLSIKHVSMKLNPKIWRMVRSIGVEYISLAFLYDFAKGFFEGGILNLVTYLPFFGMAVAGPMLRLAAAAKRLSGSQQVAAR
jgi:hypothetical protein